MMQRHTPSGRTITVDAETYRRHQCRGCAQPIMFAEHFWRSMLDSSEWCPLGNLVPYTEPGPGDLIMTPQVCDLCRFCIDWEKGTYTATGAAHLPGTCEKLLTAKEVADAIGISPRSKQVRVDNAIDMFELRNAGSWNKAVLIVLGNPDYNRMPSGPRRQRCLIVAYALYKAVASGRLCGTEALWRITAEYTPYQVCALVARIAEECPHTTIGQICDSWICRNHTSL